MTTITTGKAALAAAAQELCAAVDEAQDFRTLDINLDRDDWLLLATAMEMAAAGLLVEELTQFAEQLHSALVGEDS